MPKYIYINLRVSEAEADVDGEAQAYLRLRRCAAGGLEWTREKRESTVRFCGDAMPDSAFGSAHLMQMRHTRPLLLHIRRNEPVARGRLLVGRRQVVEERRYVL